MEAADCNDAWSGVLQILPSKLQRTVKAIYWDGMEIDEWARLCKVTPAAIRYRLKNAYEIMSTVPMPTAIAG